MFKKIGVVFAFLIFTACGLCAQEQTSTVPSAAEARKAFKAQRKKLDKLVKQYKKAAEDEKPAIKAELEKSVGERVDAGLAYVKERIAAEKANLQNWEDKVKADEERLPELKEERLNDLLSGEAKKKFKAARKQWKKQIKQAVKH